MARVRRPTGKKKRPPGPRMPQRPEEPRKLSFGTLILKLRAFFAKHEGKYTRAHLFRDAGNVATPAKAIDSDKTIKRAENHKGVHNVTLEVLALALSKKLKEIRLKHPHSPLLDPLKSPELGWLLARLLDNIEPLIDKDHLIMNHDERYLVDQYHISLTVCPCPGHVEDIARMGLPTEAFPCNDIAFVKYELVFSEHNHRSGTGFNLGYSTHAGRIELLQPDTAKLEDDKAYRIHKQSVRYLPDPRQGSAHPLELLVYGGYSGANQGAHFSMTQPAIYRHVTFSLDLTGYPQSFIKEPELIIVPVLKDRPFNCCEIAREGRGLPVKVKPVGKTWKWSFEGLRDVMIGIHWEFDETLIPENYKAPNLPMLCAMSKRFQTVEPLAETIIREGR